MNRKVKVCMISCTHLLYDDRIYWKEALSLKKHGYDVYHLGIGNENKEFESEHGIKFVLVRIKRYYANQYIDKLYRILTFKKNIYHTLYKTARDIRADVYHFHDLQINRIGKKLKRLEHNAKVIYDVHEPFPTTIRYTVSNNILLRLIHWIYSVFVYFRELRCSRYYDYIITTEENVNNKFKNYLKTGNVDIIYNYTDLSTKVNAIPVEEREYDAIYCGGIKRIRGIYMIIETMRIAKMNSRNLKFLVIGPIHEYKLRQKINRLLEKYQLTENIIIKDPVPYDQVHEFYNKSKTGLIIFLDNPIHHLILPIKLFEYMAFGLPVICSNFGHLLKYTTENRTGKLIDPGNPEDIYNAVVEILDDKTVYRQFSDNGKRASREKYNWSLMEKKLIDIYSGII
jgi:glycosyltransferase involved in cell wall biosynthesis